MKNNTRSKNKIFTTISVLVIVLFVLFPFHQTLAETNKSQDSNEDATKGFFLANSGDNILNVKTLDGYQKIDEARFESFILEIPQLENRTRSIHVYLPAEYNNNRSTYPVVYLLDSQSLFINNRQTNDEWYVDQSLYEFYTSDNQEEVILVAIESDRMHKWDEFSPWVNDNMYSWIDPYDANLTEGGEGDAFVNFMVNTLKPEIDNRYRTNQGRDNTSIGGQEMAGLLSLYAGLTRSDIYSKVIALSPSIWFAENGNVWLSDNALIQLINQVDVPQDTTFKLDLVDENQDEDQASDFEMMPYVFDKRGNRISFARAYREGLQAIITALVPQKLPSENIKGELKNSLDLFNISSQPILTNRALINKTYFPLVHTPGSPPQITSGSEATFFTNQNNTFLIVTSGSPIPSIIIEGFPEDIGITFVDNGNGTATISGQPTVKFDQNFDLLIKAQNGVDPAASQQFRLSISNPDALKCPDSSSCIVSFTMSMSPYLSRTRKIWVYLPPNYNQSGQQYQVIYLTDEQHIFGAQSGVILPSLLDWKFDEKLDDLYKRTGKGLIAVAIEYDADYPWDEYTPWDNNNMDNWTTDTYAVNGVADRFLDFMVKKLKPTVDAKVRTYPDRENTAIGGGSRCALFSIYAGLTRSGTFSKVMAMSPAVWMAEGGPALPLYQPYWLTTNQLSLWFNNNQAPRNVRHYLYTGTNESGAGGGRPFVYRVDGVTKIEWPEAYKEGADKVKQKFMSDGVNYYYRVNVGGTHYPGVWTKFIEEALLWFGFY